MFKNSENKQHDLFSSFHSHLSERKLRGIEDKSAWHNVFWTHFVRGIHEDEYAILYSAGKGRPNSSIRVLIGMMVLKEAKGWSDLQLFEESMYNLCVQVALGIHNLKEDPPGPTAYYDFRRRVGEHQRKTGEDLIAKTFSQITSKQVQAFSINGEQIRLDSKLIQSNIAKSTRLQLITEAVRSTLRKKEIKALRSYLTEAQYKIVEALQEKSTSNITYSLSQVGKVKMLEDMGYIIHGMIKAKLIGDGDILHTLYSEQYVEQEDENDKNQDNQSPIEIKLQASNKISSQSIQSIHDPQAAYRKKGKEERIQKVHGYHTNITETCTEEEQPNLIIEVNTQRANVSESEMLCPAIEQSKRVLGYKNEIKEVITDGGYDGIQNRASMQSTDMPAWRMHKLKGGERAYAMKYDQNNKLIVLEAKTKKECRVTWLEKKQKYKIKGPNQKQARYFTLAQVADYIEALTIVAGSTEEHYNLRANVESTIHQTFHRLKSRNKIMYRGMIKCHWYALARAFGVNITRISKFLSEITALFSKSDFFIMLTSLVSVIIINGSNQKYNRI